MSNVGRRVGSGVVFVAALAALTGCAGSHDQVNVGTGIFALTISGDRDVCRPARTTGPMGTVGVVSSGDVLNLAVPDLVNDAPMRVSLQMSTGWSDERTDTVCGNAALTRSYSVVSGTATAFDVAYTEQWSGLSGCTDAARAAMPSAPAGDCRADLVLHYRLDTACAAPCEIRVAADGSPSCACR